MLKKNTTAENRSEKKTSWNNLSEIQHWLTAIWVQLTIDNHWSQHNSEWVSDCCLMPNNTNFNLCLTSSELNPMTYCTEGDHGNHLLVIWVILIIKKTRVTMRWSTAINYKSLLKFRTDFNFCSLTSTTLTWLVSDKEQDLLTFHDHLVSPPVFRGVPGAHCFSFLCCVFLLCLFSSCAPSVASVSGLSLSCVLCSQCCQCLWIVFVLCLVLPVLPVSLDCLCPVSCAPSVASVSGLPILDCPFHFLSRLFNVKKNEFHQI
jgi:hypothetical protein